MAFNTFLKFTGPDIDGASTYKGLETWIEVHSWNYGCHQPTSAIRGSAGGGTIERVHHSPFTFTKQIDSSSDDLLKMCWSGKHITKMEFRAYRAVGDAGAEQSGMPYLKIELDSVIVQDFSVNGAGGDLPHESVSLTYAAITYTYDPQTKDGGVGSGAQVIKHKIDTNEVI